MLPVPTTHPRQDKTRPSLDLNIGCTQSARVHVNNEEDEVIASRTVSPWSASAIFNNNYTKQLHHNNLHVTSVTRQGLGSVVTIGLGFLRLEFLVWECKAK